MKATNLINQKNILVTGGAGYIGTHTLVELLSSGCQVVVIDNLSNASREALRRVEIITGKTVPFIKGDIRDRILLRSAFQGYEIDAVIHFAGLKSVNESVEEPLNYYDNNVTGSLALIEVMSEFGCKSLVFSSSAAVYGDPANVPVNERDSLSPTTPYASSKLMVENILRHVHVSDPAWSIAILRYFNPVGAHVSGLIGEAPNGMPSNLMPYVSQVAHGKYQKLKVYGDDYDTPDGTGVRDYIHVSDLASGHTAALEKLFCSSLSTDLGVMLTLNLGTGRGYSVLEVIDAFQKASGRLIEYEVVERRPGDAAKSFADTSLALDLLGWTAKHDINRMCEDAWRWQSMNPEGFESDK